MTKLSDTQLTILSAAARRPDGNLLPLPGSLRGGAAGKVVAVLLARGLVREQVIDSTRTADPALNTVWRNLEDGRGVVLFITAAGAEAIGIEAVPEGTGAGAPDAATGADVAAAGSDAGRRGRPHNAAPGAPDRAAPEKAREGTKQAALIGMLRRPEGATIAQIVAATGWQPHTVRGAFAGALKKKLGLTVTSEKLDGTRVYRIG